MEKGMELLMYLNEIRDILQSKHKPGFDLTCEIITMTELIKHYKEIDKILQKGD